MAAETAMCGAGADASQWDIGFRGLEFVATDRSLASFAFNPPR